MIHLVADQAQSRKIPREYQKQLHRDCPKQEYPTEIHCNQHLVCCSKLYRPFVKDLIQRRKFATVPRVIRKCRAAEYRA